MSSRGSYLIDGVCMYIHHDNYPEGSAHYFCETLKSYHKLDLFSFIRTNLKAEKIDRPLWSGEEFYYEVRKDEIFCYSVTEDDKKVFHSSDKIDVWVNRYVKELLDKTDKIQDYTIIRNGNLYYSVTQIIENANEAFKRGVECIQKGFLGNGSAEFNDAFKWANLVIDYDDFSGLRKSYKAIWSPYLAKQYDHSSTELFDSYAEMPESIEAGN